MNKFLLLSLSLVSFLPLTSYADQNLAGNVTVTGGSTTGNLNVTGSLDVDGPVVSFGTIGTSTVGNSLIFSDSTATSGTTGDTLTFSANRTSASWLWLHNASKSAMRLNSLHQLLLYQVDGSTVGITLTPASNQLSLGTATLTGSGTTLTAGAAMTITGTLTAQSSVINNGTLTGGTTGLNLAAGGTNQNITLTPSGTGNTIFNGNVGIGTSNPGVKLDINGGDVRTIAPSVGFVMQAPDGWSGGWANRGFSFTNSNNTVLAQFGAYGQGAPSALNYAYIGTSYTSPWVSFKPNGNVGVGTTAPGYKLEISGTGNGNLGLTSSGHTFIQSVPGAGANSYYDNLLVGSRTFFRTSNTVSADTNAICILANGNVGIGTTGPAAELDINSAAAGGLALNVTGGQGGLTTAVITSNYPNVAANGTTYIRNIGFYSYSLPIAAGITDSGYRIGLDIENFATDPNFLGTLSQQFGLWARVGSYIGGAGTIQNSYGVYIENLDGPATIGNKYGLYQSNSTAKNYFAGNVGIGTTNPTQKLSVAGTVRAYAVVVDTGWSDYVFDKDYRLAPLSEVEQHIKAEKHLPGIPSAAEVAEHGISLGDMQAKLLAKIEELTLRQIAQEKQLNAQAARIEQLEQDNSALRNR